MTQLTFETLINYHKQEGQEELAYLTILFTVILGIIGFLGSAQKIDKAARLLILLFYIGLHSTMVSSFISSMKIHGALHEEIAMYVKAKPEMFLEEKKSTLFIQLEQMHGHNITNMTIAGYALLVFMILCILSLGKNELLRWTRIERLFKKDRSGPK